MNKSEFVKKLLAIMVGSALVSGTALAEDSATSQTHSINSDTRTKIDNSVKKVDGYMGDSSLTAKVKAALINDSAIKSTDISVKTEQGEVTLSGFVASQAQAEKAVAVTKGVEGVKSVSDKLQVKDSSKQTIKSYGGDAITTSEIKAKLLADDIVPSRKVKVTTTNGVVQLSGTVDNSSQSERAEGIAKSIKGVKTVKNDLNVKP